MGRRGPLPMPQHLRVLRGDTSGRTTARSLTLRPGAPKPPTTLKGEALAEWKRIVPILQAKAVLSPADRAILTMYCDAWAVARMLRKMLEDEGFILTDRDGTLRKHPAWQEYREAMTLATQLGKELLITPATRLRTSLPEPNDDEQTAAAALLD